MKQHVVFTIVGVGLLGAIAYVVYQKVTKAHAAVTAGTTTTAATSSTGAGIPAGTGDLISGIGTAVGSVLHSLTGGTGHTAQTPPDTSSGRPATTTNPGGTATNLASGSASSSAADNAADNILDTTPAADLAPVPADNGSISVDSDVTVAELDANG